MRRGFATIFCSVQEYLFPLFCLSCDREGDWLCNDCFLRHLSLSGVFCCPVCHVKTANGSVCENCHAVSEITRHAAALPYQEHTVLAEVLHTLKYNFAESTLPVFDRLMKKFVEHHAAWFADIDIIVPIPLHRKRLAERGFNQAEKIAEFVSLDTHVPISYGVARKKRTLQQALLSKSEREKNVDQAFIATADYTNKIVLLIDDIYTTGSTMQSCASAIRARGAKEVRGWTVARG